MQAAKKQKTSASNGTSSASKKVTLTFSVKDAIGVLEEALVVFKKNKINLTRLESRPASAPEWDYDFLVSFDGAVSDQLTKAFETEKWGNLRIFKEEGDEEPGSVWFPHKIQDLDLFASRVLDAGAELESDHPGFTDIVYRERRKMIVQHAKDHKHGNPLPLIEYTESEVKTWGTVYEKLTGMFATHACESFNKIFPLLEKNCGYSKDNIPQLRDISRFLKQCTGFQLRPVPGLLSPRDFLNGLAFRVFHSTQYLRHETKPFYTPEPDICHELLGHVPLFADPDFAAFSQEIGLASLGASDEFVEQLATCYWFTVEFGLCKEGGQMKAYGAGLLSSFGELEYSLSDKPKLLPFDPFVTGVTKYPITTYQPTYFVTESFAEAMKKMRTFAQTSDRPFGVRYNPYTESIEVLDTPEKLGVMFTAVNEEMEALRRSVSTLLKRK